jgi:hypothetical protein
MESTKSDNIVIGVAAYFILFDTPKSAKFLSHEEAVEIERRLGEDASCLADEFDMKYVWDALKDWVSCSTRTTFSSLGRHDTNLKTAPCLIPEERLDLELPM